MVVVDDLWPLCPVYRPTCNPPCETRAQDATSFVPRQKPAEVYEKEFSVDLFNQAVQCLDDIWRQEDIPEAFLIPVGDLPLDIQPSPLLQNAQSPSSVTTSTSLSTESVSFSASTECIFPQPQQMISLKRFVYGILRRSKTPARILQIAILYLEMIRFVVPWLVEQENNGLGVQGEVDLSYRIVRCDPQAEEWHELAPESTMVGFDMDAAVESDTRTSDIMSVTEAGQHHASAGSLGASSMNLKTHVAPQSLAKKYKVPSSPLPPLSPLPSPLLCPRRAFLASLILASKFSQDRCYSNKAWAKISGLPLREIGRCERALGEALDWRLWYDKLLF